MKKEITTSFNVMATLAILLLEVLHSFSTYEIGSTNNSDTLLDFLLDSALLKTSLLFVFFIFAALILSMLFKAVWNRLISDVFNVRQINLNESYAVCIVLSWVVSG